MNFTPHFKRWVEIFNIAMICSLAINLLFCWNFICLGFALTAYDCIVFGLVAIPIARE